MLDLITPQPLHRGDKVATVSLSWGGAGDPDLLWRYQLGKKRLADVFGLEVVEMPKTLKGSAYLYEHPEKRAEDFMQAFADPSIKGIFSCIGGNESIRLLPYIDFDVIRRNPKVFIGYSDTTVAHFMCMKGGLSSFYGPSILAELAENIEIYEYTQENLKKLLFETTAPGIIGPSPKWTGDYLEWIPENKNTAKKLLDNDGYELLQGSGKVSGRLIGGCIDVLEMMKGTTLWNTSDFEGGILFFDTSEDSPEPDYIEYWLRNYGSQGILQIINGIIWSKPYQHKYYEEYKASIIKIMKELGLGGLPILYNLNFGHSEPMCVLPYGRLAEIDCDNKTFSIGEPGVKDWS